MTGLSFWPLVRLLLTVGPHQVLGRKLQCKESMQINLKHPNLLVKCLPLINNRFFLFKQGATTFGNMDFTLDESQNILKTALNNLKANVVLSDMAPSATGISSLDTENIINLCYSVLRFAVQMTQVGGTILVKLWQCGETKQLETDIGRYYKMVRIVKPNSSRADSAEIFILGREFKGLKVS
ncbi:rRNA methyltransferase 2, mitochondrial isoform X2 [Aethina tumida]|uniref:rRNA methyltransferase 2, mitochondrial isoform X2 n=1 Tax=Aethina tumida TaxID=116153 RepID=UPI00096B3B8B|nr:rRNA methyltransferase 2, mitochondrial isoform X2 [Aethina tumida]